VLDAEAKTSLERTIDRNTSLPGVSGRPMLNGGDYGPPGLRRLTCLTDGSTLVVEVWKMCGTRTQRNSAVVWNYTREKGRPMVYGVGHFVRTDLGSGRTRIQWTYSFQVNHRRFRVIWGVQGISSFASVSLTENRQRWLAGSKRGLSVPPRRGQLE
jgi:hypothetical protein